MVLCVAPNPIQSLRQPKEISRRQLLGYVNNIVHENPNYPDQAAQSSVKVNFNSNDQSQQIYTGNYQDFSNPPQSQLFNVGYSVRFTNGNRPPVKTQTPQKFRSNLENAEIITGTRKQNEEVQGPPGINPQDFTSISLISNKKHKISGIKPKPQIITTYQNPKTLLSQANLSPTTQKYYKALEQAKPQVGNIQDLQQKYSWRNLSPGVEIIKSTEVPTLRYTKPEVSPSFDHAKALGRSQDFDQSNAVESSTPQQNVLYFANPVVAAKYPIDTTLLREQQVPIPVDTRFVNEEMRKLALYAKYPQEQQVQEVNYLQQAYRTIPESPQVRPVLVYQEQPQQQDYQPEQSRFQFKIYGKAQPISTRQAEEPVLRQPRFLKDLYTNMRPPPFSGVYQRRIQFV